MDRPLREAALLEHPCASTQWGRGDQVRPDGAAEDLVDAIRDAVPLNLDDGGLQRDDVARVEEAGCVVAGGCCREVDSRFAVDFGHLADLGVDQRLGVVHDAQCVDPEVAQPQLLGRVACVREGLGEGGLRDALAEAGSVVLLRRMGLL